MDNAEDNKLPTIREMFAETRSDVRWIKRWMEKHERSHTSLEAVISELERRVTELEKVDCAQIGVRSFLRSALPVALQTLAVITAILGLKGIGFL